MPPIISKIVVSGYENLKLIRRDDEIYITNDKTIEEVYYPNMVKDVKESILNNVDNIIPDIVDLIVQFSHCDTIDIVRKGKVKQAVSSKYGLKILKQFENLYSILLPNNNITLFIKETIMDFILHKDDENVIITKITIETTKPRYKKSSMKVIRTIEMTKNININIRSNNKLSDFPSSYWDFSLVPSDKWALVK